MINADKIKYLELLGMDLWTLKKDSQQENPRYSCASDADNHRDNKCLYCKLENLRHSVADCRACNLCETRQNLVFGTYGPATLCCCASANDTDKHKKRIMLIGEAPGAEEDLQGEPFVGRAGMLLMKIMESIDFQRSNIYITNILKCRPPNNRDPLPNETAACAPLLYKQIEIINPQIIIAIGRIAAQFLLKTNETIGKLRGKIHHVDSIPIFAIYHPAYLLRSPSEKRKVYDDLKRINAYL